jgi:hypothetical protein
MQYEITDPGFSGSVLKPRDPERGPATPNDEFRKWLEEDEEDPEDIDRTRWTERRVQKMNGEHTTEDRDVPGEGRQFIIRSSRVRNSDGKMIPVLIEHLQAMILADFHQMEIGKDLVKTQWYKTWKAGERPISCTDREYVDAAFDILQSQLEVIKPPEGTTPAQTVVKKGEALRRLGNTEPVSV